jgi:hypothetical protein
MVFSSGTSARALARAKGERAMEPGTLLLMSPDGTRYAIPQAELTAFRLTQKDPLIVKDADGGTYAIPQAALDRFAVAEEPAAEAQGYGDPWSFRDPDVGKLGRDLGVYRDPPKFLGPTGNVTPSAPVSPPTQTWGDWFCSWFM